MLQSCCAQGSSTACDILKQDPELRGKPSRMRTTLQANFDTLVAIASIQSNMFAMEHEHSHAAHDFQTSQSVQ